MKRFYLTLHLALTKFFFKVSWTSSAEPPVVVNKTINQQILILNCRSALASDHKSLKQVLVN